VKLLFTNRSKPSIESEYATSDEFRRLFTKDMVALMPRFRCESHVLGTAVN